MTAFFPNNPGPLELRPQSPYLYLQSAGSDGNDGSAEGIHLRWDFLRNLGDTHLPKGNAATSSVNFNRTDDFVRIWRSPYVTRYPTILDFTVPPDNVHDAQYLWAYLTTNTGHKLYVHFRDTAKYDSVRSSINPSTDPWGFVQAYGDKMIEVESPDELFFAAGFASNNAGNSRQLRVETISVTENFPISDRFVSCRKGFDRETWCVKVPPSGSGGGGGQEGGGSSGGGGKDITGSETTVENKDNSASARTTEGAPKAEAFSPSDVPSCCSNPNNLIANGGFETGNVGFFSDYNYQSPPAAGRIQIIPNAAAYHSDWEGLAHKGDVFLAVDGATRTEKTVWGQTPAVAPETDYCFSGWVCNLRSGDPAILLTIRIEDRNRKLLASLDFDGPATPNDWQEFSVNFNSGNTNQVTIRIFSRRTNSIGNDFGLDHLYLCQGSECSPHLMSENIRSVRFAMSDGSVSRVEIETYQDYMDKASWARLNDDYSLTVKNALALRWLEDTSAYPIHDRWPKFNDGSRVNIPNYEHRWSRANGIREGVNQYISLSNTDPLAMNTLAGQNAVDGSMQVSMLNLLQLVALDYHVARMLGLGAIDPVSGTPYIHLASYETRGELDDTNVARSVGHLYMTLPTSVTDYRLPEVPTLKPLQYGLYIDNGLANPSPLTDAQGYTPTGEVRYISLFMEQEDATPTLGPFFVPADPFCSHLQTNSVFFGIEYRLLGESNWRKPEIGHDDNYVDTSSPAYAESMPSPNHGEPDRAILVHPETEAGFHQYAPYGVNWFSRPSTLGNIRQTDETIFVKANLLIPPANFAVQLIQEESPLLLTTSDEQAMLGSITGSDKTLIRVTFDYFHTHDVTYDFGDQVEIFFRQDDPGNVMGQIKSVTDLSPETARVRTESYTQNSTGVTIAPSLTPGQMPAYVGGVLTSSGRNFIIEAVSVSAVSGEGPIFDVRKIEENTAVDPGTGQFVTVLNYLSPQNGNTFMAVENMADPGAWPSATNPLTKVVELHAGSPVTETFTEDGETITQEVRGVWQNATIADELDGFGNIIGVYRIDFNSFLLADHPQASDPDPVNWYRGVVRIPKASAPTGPRKVLEVIKVENVGTASNLRIFAADATYDAGDPILTGGGVNVNYYPGYRVYLHADVPNGLTEANILPSGSVFFRKTWMATRSLDTSQGYDSLLSVPSPVIAMGFIDPLPPEAPNGGVYATRPDFYFKSTWTFSVQFAHKPFAAAFYRATEDRILRALYQDATVADVKAELAQLGDDDPYKFDRWRNLVSFDYVYDDPGKPFYDATGTNPNGTFRRFPREAGNFRFPKPDNPDLFTGSDEPGAVLSLVQEAVWSAFTPLTEQPLLYQYIKPGAYQPIPKPQTIRDQDGNLLDPTDPTFDQSPMAKKLGGNKIQFTDFTLDGSSNMLYFYLGREIGSRGKLSPPSPIAGPVGLINTRPPEIPGIKRTKVVPASRSGTGPRVEFEVNGYPVEQKVRQLKIYRSTDPAAALTVRTMECVKTIDLVAEGMAEDFVYQVQDDFADGFVPYGEPVYYRIIARREVKNAQGQTEWAPSKPSKLILTMVADVLNPEAPAIRYSASPIGGNPAQISGVTLEWNTTTYNGTYYLEKMNHSGVWNTIYTVQSNAATVPPLDLATTDLLTNILIKEGESGRPRYHLFRVRVENSSGLFNLVEKELVI